LRIKLRKFKIYPINFLLFINNMEFKGQVSEARTSEKLKTNF
jgi:hypothetical protein